MGKRNRLLAAGQACMEGKMNKHEKGFRASMLRKLRISQKTQEKKRKRGEPSTS